MTLSDKALDKGIIDFEYVYLGIDVKQAIKELKEQIVLDCIEFGLIFPEGINKIYDRIDKIFGDKLIWTT